MRLLRVERESQRFSGTEEMRLPDELLQGPGPKSIRQRSVGRPLLEEIIH